MSGRRLTRATYPARPAAPVRHVHLGLGAFFRAHQADYTDRSPDAADWGIAAFTGRSRRLADDLAAQDGLYTLVVRSPQRDEPRVVAALSRAHPAADRDAWRAYLADPRVVLVTSTVTEAAYLQRPGGGLDLDRPGIQTDLAALRAGRLDDAGTVPGRLLAGLAARRDADAGPITLLPCDNLPDNGGLLARSLAELAEAVGPGLADWVGEQVSTVSSLVDRITPHATPAEVAAIREYVDATEGFVDACPVVTEPYAEWVLCGTFAAGAPAWHRAARPAAVRTDDLAPYERRKLWLLNGAHSLLAYTGPARGHETVAAALADELLRGWVEQWWDEAERHLAAPVPDYRAALASRFGNPRIAHPLSQIAQDGVVKLRARVLPVVRLERAAGRIPLAAARILAAWADPSGTNLAARLGELDPALPDDAELVAAVAAARAELTGSGRT